MSSLIDAFNNFIKSLRPQEVGQLNLRSCLGCSFHKLLLKEHFCSQVQPPSKILNPYDAQLCIYYTPETATTGQITKAERETQSSQLDLIKLINRINLIDAITSISKIDRVHIMPNNLIKNGDFANGTLDGWENEFSAVSTTQKRSGLYSCDIQSVMPGGAGSIWQYLPNVLTDVLTLSLWHFSDVTDTVVVNVYYTDGTSSQTTDNGTGNWVFKVITLTAGKRLKYVHIVHLMDTKHCYIGDITLVESIDWRIISQSTRTNLLNKPEREDLLLLDKDYASNVALQIYLSAGGVGLKHKIYAYGYESDADGIYYFSATVNGSAFKFGRRITKGVMVQTLVHPIVCDGNTALYFMSTTGNSKAWIQYKTEG